MALSFIRYLSKTVRPHIRLLARNAPMPRARTATATAKTLRTILTFRSRGARVQIATSLIAEMPMGLKVARVWLRTAGIEIECLFARFGRRGKGECDGEEDS